MAEHLLEGVSVGGHLMAQVAACRRGLGLARAPRLRLLDVRGGEGDLREIALELVGRLPEPGECVRIRGGWWQTQTAHRALLLAAAAQREGFDRLVEIAVAFRPDVAVEDLSEAHAGLVLAGPLAERLAASPAARLAAPVMVAGDAEDHRVLVLPARRADDAWHVLLDAGRRLGAVAVDVRATDLHCAAQRTIAAQPQPIEAPLLPTDPPTTGARLS